MQVVSEHWKNAHRRTLLSESFVEISLGMADPESLADAKSQDNGAIYISNSSLLTDGIDESPTPYCTLEQNLWCLDGNRKALPESDFGDNCYISDAMSDDTCVFSEKLPSITIQFANGKVYNKLIPGITITWSKTYGEFADSFLVVAYQGETVVAEKEVVDNKSVKTMVFADIVNYDRIVVVIKKWCLPHHRARVEEIYVGVDKVYGKSELFDYSHSQSVDLSSLSLPKSEIKFSIDNVDGEYNPYNRDGLAKYLMERQEVNARYGLKMDDGSIEWIKGGIFYLSEWSAKQNGLTAEFSARDLLEFMSSIYYDTDYSEVTLGTPTADGTVVDGNGNVVVNADGKILYERSLYDLAKMVLISAELPLNSDGTTKWVIDESLRNMKTTAPLPEDTRANCLQLIANAAMCVLYQDREGKLRITPFEFNVIPNENDVPDYRITPFNSYTKSEITLAKPIKTIGVKFYTYSLDDDKNVNGKYQTFYHVGHLSEGETIVVDNPLVTDATVAQAIEGWLYNQHLRWRKTLESSWRADVRLDALDFVENENEYSTERMLITEVEYQYNGAFRAKGKGKVIGDG